jgi:S-adenosylhomocysteine hydrolase
MPAKPGQASGGSRNAHLECDVIAVGTGDIDVTRAIIAPVSGYAVRSTEDDESAGGYFVTGTMKDLVPTW